MRTFYYAVITTKLTVKSYSFFEVIITYRLTAQKPRLIVLVLQLGGMNEIFFTSEPVKAMNKGKVTSNNFIHLQNKMTTL